MSDSIKHECGIAMVRLRKPFSYYLEKYDTPLYAIKKLYLLMQKQHNRGQDGAGIATLKLDIQPGKRYLNRYRSIEALPIADIFQKVDKKVRKAMAIATSEQKKDPEWIMENVPFTGEILLGHLRYGTHSKNSIEYCHPMIRQDNWRSKNLIMAGNFNMTNVDRLFDKLVELGQHPKEKADTITVLEKIGHFLDEECQRIFTKYRPQFNSKEISEIIANELDIQNILERSCKDFDGGYAMMGVIGSGGSFVARDPNGIRPAYYYVDDEVVVVASEKPAIKTAFNVEYKDIKEIKPAHALIINKQGDVEEKQFIKVRDKKSCSFERIYFSRGTDPEIYQERKMLGRLLIPQILDSINNDLENTVFSFIPNTAETAYMGMINGVVDYLRERQKKTIQERPLSDAELERILNMRPRVEKIVIKDAKLRTFITDDDHRDDLVTHVYDTTYEVVRKNKDTLVVLDDSIVRGTTLEVSILKMLDRIGPKKIIIVSSAPQIRYPDCYGIDMSKMKEFVAFRALLALLKENNKEYLLDEVYSKCKDSLDKPLREAKNHVKELYDQFTYDEITNKISEIVTPKEIKAEVQVIYQTVENLHKACPNHGGDWYFTGEYPTPGGNRVVNKAFTYFMEGKTVRAY